MELDAFNEEIKLPQKGKKKAYEVEYDDFTQQAVEGLMKADMDHIVSLFGVNVSGLYFFLSDGLVVLCPATCAILSRAWC